MKKRTSLFLLIAAGFAINCHADTFVRDDIIADPDPARFNVCYGHGCASLAWVTLNAEQWEQVRGVFAEPAGSAADERAQIGAGIALLERLVGAMTPTGQDKGGNWKGWGLPGQMDCVDESTNTATYLRMLQKYGLMRWHTVTDRATRISLFSWPHQTAVIEERGNRKRWAVDSWFLDNGEPPFVLPLHTWKDGWKPPQTEPAQAQDRPQHAESTQ